MSSCVMTLDKLREEVEPYILVVFSSQTFNLFFFKILILFKTCKLFTEFERSDAKIFLPIQTFLS